jgi:transketolase
MIKNQALKRRIIEISFKNNLSHLGSCLSAVDIIQEIYEKKGPKDIFVLSAGHAGLAWYVVLESLGGKNAEEIFNHHGVHPDRCMDCGLTCSSGSLGQGLPIAAGMALADRYRDVYLLTSDGEMQEGSCHETTEVMWREKITNLKVYVNCNGFGAYDPIDYAHLKRRYDAYYDQNIYFKDTSNVVNDFPVWLSGQAGHYYTMSEESYKEAMEILA